jgi:hypothetical protein
MPQGPVPGVWMIFGQWAAMGNFGATAVATSFADL